MLQSGGVVGRHIHGVRLVDNPCLRQSVLDAGVGRAVEDGRNRLEAEVVRRPAQVRFQHLAKVHARRHANRVEYDVNRRSVRQEGHVLFGHNLRHDALVAVPSCHLVAFGNLAGLRYPQAHHLVDAGGELVLIDAVQHLDADDLASLAVGNAQGSVLHIARLFAEYGAQKLFLRAQLGFALRRNLADKDVAGLDFRAYADDALFVEVSQAVFAHVRDVPRNLFGAELRVSRLDFVLLDVYRGELVVLHQLAAEDDGVLEVVAFPAHERDQHILS